MRWGGVIVLARCRYAIMAYIAALTLNRRTGMIDEGGRETHVGVTHVAILNRRHVGGSRV